MIRSYLSADDQASEATPGAGKKGGGGHTEAAVNNLSFPVYALNGFQITPISESFMDDPIHRSIYRINPGGIGNCY